MDGPSTDYELIWLKPLCSLKPTHNAAEILAFQILMRPNRLRPGQHVPPRVRVPRLTEKQMNTTLSTSKIAVGFKYVVSNCTSTL